MPLPRRAFTLIEMLITIGLILLLASLIIVALRGVRGAANRLVSNNALRQMCMAYNTYSADNEQQLMPGYVSATRLRELDINARMWNGVLFNDPIDPDWDDPNDASSYVWRLAPYLAHEWKVMFVDYRSRELTGKLTSEFDRGIHGPGTADWNASPCSEMGISLIPSFGLNSILVGGDNVHGGTDITERNPWDDPANKLAATRFSEVKNPSKLIIFAPTMHYDDASLFPDTEECPQNPLPLAHVRFGYVELRPPFIEGLKQWHIKNNEVVADGDFEASDAKNRPIGGGWPIARWDKSQLPVGHLDGSVTTEDINNLAQDMSNWNPFDIGFDH